MMDKLEQYIIQHREQLQLPEGNPQPPNRVWEGISERLEEEALRGLIAQATPQPKLPTQLWSNIEGQLDEEGKTREKLSQRKLNKEAGQVKPPPKMVPIQRIWQLAAAFAVILVASLFLQSYWQGTLPLKPENMAMEKAHANLANHQFPELERAEQYYMAVIEKKRSSLEQYDPKQYGINPKELEAALQQLDRDYKQLKTDFDRSQQPEQVLQPMIQNLQLRMSLLNQQLQLLDKLKQHESTQTEGLQYST